MDQWNFKILKLGIDHFLTRSQILLLLENKRFQRALSEIFKTAMQSTKV